MAVQYAHFHRVRLLVRLSAVCPSLVVAVRESTASRAWRLWCVEVCTVRVALAGTAGSQACMAFITYFVVTRLPTPAEPLLATYCSVLLSFSTTGQPSMCRASAVLD